MAKKWSDVAASSAFQALSLDQQEEARQQYFEDVVAPQVPEEDLDVARSQFYADTQKTLARAADTGDESARLAARYPAPKQPGLLERAASAISSALPKPVDPMGIASGKPLANEPIAPQAPAPKQREVTPYRNRTEALDDAVNLLEEGADKDVVRSSFEKGGIKFSEIVAHGKKRGSDYFKQETIPRAEARTTPVEPTGEIKPIETSLVDDAINLGRRAAARSSQSFTNTLFQAGIIGEDAAAQQFAKDQKRIEGAAPPESIQEGMQAIGSSKTYGDAALNLASNPAATFTMLTESLLQSAPQLALAVSRLPMAARVVGTGAFSGAMEFGGTMADVLADRGVDMTNAAAVSDAIKNPEVRDAIREKGAARGLTIGVIDALTAGFAGKFLEPVQSSIRAGKLAEQAARRATIGAWSKELGLQIAGGSGGEALAQTITGENKPADVLLEGLAEGFGAPLEARANLRESSDLMPSAQISRAIDEAVAGGQWTTSAQQEAAARLDPNSYDPTMVSPLETSKPVALAPISIVNFTEPGSATAQAGLTPIVVPIPERTAPSVPTDVQVNPETEREFGLDKLRMGGGNVGTAGGVLSATAAGGQPAGDLGGAGLGNAGIAGVDTARPAGTGPNGLVPVGGETAPAGGAGSQPATPLTQPTEQWFGRRGDGYQTEGDATQALGGRKRMFPELDWKIELMPNGKYRLAGYNLETASGTQAPQAQQAQAQGAQAGQLPAIGTAPVPGAAPAGGVQAPQLPGPLPEGLKLAPTAPMGVIKSVRNQLIRDDQLEVAAVSQAEMTDQQKLASMVARLTGKTLTVIKYASGNRDAMPNAFIDQLGGKHIFVADDSNDAPLFVAVHEAYHGLPEEKRQVLNTALLDLFRQDKKGEFLTEFNYQEKDFNEEAPAFMVQALSKRPEFWNDVRQKLGNKEFAEVAKVIINKFQEILTGANKAYGEDFVNKYISDVKKAHDLLTTAYADAMREQGFTPDIETTGKIAASNRVVEQAPAPKFYSQLQRSFEQVPERIATQPASQWKVWLTSNAPKLGVKKDEIEWSGINDYLEMRGRDKVSKAEISDYLANNGVKVEEVQLKESDKSTLRPKYAGYTLDGGGNYREVLLTLPSKQGPNMNDVANQMFGRRFNELSAYQQDQARRMASANDEGNYRSIHWDQPNVLAHIRVTDRTSPDKKKVLFVEEIQSDWGQEGKKKGFQGSKQFTVRPDTSGKEALAGRWEVVDQDGNIEEGFRTEAEANRWAKIEQQGQGVPAAPFVSKRGEAGKYRDNTEGWLNLALKRIAMMAIEGGYDRVAFVNGEQSADRYDLSKSVQSLSYKPLGEDLGLLEAWSPDRDQVIRERVSPDKVEDYVGKEVAQRLLATEPVMGKHLLDGEDLKVGGEGMKTFYDQIVPQAINKLMPKLGAGKLATTDINTVDGRDDIEVSRYDVMDDLEIPAERQDDYWYNLTPIERNDLTNDYRRRNPVLVPTSQPGFEVTDAMRAAVSAGLPMFSKRAQGEDIGAKLQQRVDSDFDGASQEYSQLNGTKGGRVLDTDIARELSPEYKQDRTRSAEVHEAASDFIQREYERRIATAEPGGEVVFMAGGGGSGKSSAESLLAPVLEGAHTVYDGTLSSYDKAERNIQMALDAGQLVNVAYVYREPEEAFRNGVLTRAMRKGRTVPIDALVKGHAGSSETVRRLQEKFGDNPRFSIKAVDNSRGPGKAVVTDLASITPVIKSGLKERFENAARQEYEAGRISDAVYRGTTGRAADAGAGSQSSRADGRVRSEVPGSVQERAGSEQSGNPVTKDEAVVDGIRYSARSRNLVDIPTIEIKDLVDKKVVGIKADLTDAGRSYTGIDGSQLEFPVEMMGGPNFVRLPENFQANVIWAVRGGATLSKILTQVKKADYVLVHAMNGNSHLTNSTISTAYLQTVEAYLRDGRISKDNLKALDEIVRSPKNKSSLPDFPGFESPEIYSYIDGLSFDQRGALAQILEKKEAQAHGLPNLERFRRETIDPDFAGYRQGDAMLVLKVDKENPTVKLGEEGTKLHPSYPLGLRGKVIGKLAKGINYEVIFRDYFKFAVPNFKNGMAGAWYAFDRLLPVQKITKQIAESVAPGGFSSIKTARQAEAALNFANGNWLVSGKTKAQGGISVQEFVDALRANDGAAALTLYSAEEVKAGIKDKSFTIYQLGKEGGDKGLQVFFGLKRGAPWYKDMIPGVSDNEVEVVSVTNNESGAPGVGIPAIITKAISEGATVLDAFAVKSARFPNGFLPEMYAQFGFEEIGRIPFDPSYYDANGLADLKAFWSRGGWSEADGYPDVVVMRWKGNDEDRATAVERYVRSGDTGVSAQVPRYTRAAAGEPDQRGDTSRREKRGSLSGERGEARGDQGAGDAASVVKRAFGSIQELATLGDGDIRNLGLDPAEVERLRDGLVAIQRSNRLAEPARGPGARPDADDGRTVTGIHYGNSAGLSSLSGAAFGSGIKGAEQARLAEPGVDPRIKKRVYFYLTNGMTDMPRPEIGLGAHVYRASLGNMYDPTRASAADVKRVRDAMKGSGANAFESAVLDAGYRGYVNREQGTAVVLNANVPVAYEGLAQASKMRDRVIERVVQAPMTRQDGDELVRKPTNDEMMGIIKARPALAKAAPSFRLEFGDARVKAVEVDAANRALEEAGASFQFDDALIDGKIQYSKRTKPAPEKTVTAYKLFRVDERKPGLLFPLFVDANTPVPVGEWLDADIGPAAPGGKVKSKLGPLAFRPGWHAGDLPIATHIGGKSSPDLKAPDIRPANQVWAEIEMAADRDWQTEANKRGTNASGKLVAVKAHITDQLPEDGYYRYKTNPNMTGNWLIGGSMKVTRILSDDEVVAINKAAGTADLPRQEPFDSEKYGFGQIRKSNRATSLEEDLQEQQVFLQGKAEEAGYSDLEDFVANDYEGFVAAAKEWRDQKPVSVMFSKRVTPADRIKWRSITDVKNEIGLDKLPAHIVPFANFMRTMSEKAKNGDLTARDLIKAYTIARSSMNRGAITTAKARDAGLVLPANFSDEKIRPEGAFGYWLLSDMGQRYLNAAEKQEVDADAIANAVKVMAPFGTQNALGKDLERAASGDLHGRLPAMAAAIVKAASGKNAVKDWQEATDNLYGVREAKKGFLGSLLGFGQLPTFDARQINVNVTGESKEDTLRALSSTKARNVVAKLARRMDALSLTMDPQYAPFYRHLVHHAVWDAVGKTETTHEDVMESMIMASRRSNKAKESWFLGRDELGRIKLGAGAKAYRLVADVANNVLDRVAMKPISTDLSRAIRKMKVEVDQARLLTADAADHLSKLTEDERLLISDVIEGELKAGVKPPKRVLEVAASMQGIMSEQTAELVRLGMLSADAAGRWDGKYLPRFYESKLKDEGKAWVKAAKSLLGRPRTMQGIKGSSLKGRGMFQTIPVSELQTWVAQGWEERDPNFDPAVDTEITVWRDYSRDEREKMGEIRDAMFRFVMGYTKSQQDIALGRLYEQLANTVASKSEIEGYVQVPSTNVEDTKARRYGKLAGKWVPKEVMDHLSATDSSMQSDVMKFYLKALSMWKEGKTVLNPVSHANNVISNLTVAHFAGVSYWDAHKYIGATRDLVQRSPMVREAEDAGLFGGTMTQAELVDMLPDQLKVLAAKTESKAARGVDAVWNAMSFWLRKPLGKAYEAEDLYFRYLIYRDARQRGLEPDDAVEYAQKYIFTYDDLPKGARAVRNFALPFFSYTYKAIPMLAQTALETPWRYAAPAAAIYTINAIMYAFAAGAGDDDDDWMSIIKRYVTDADFRAKAKELEQEERKNLPEWMKGASLTLGTSKAVRLGVDEVTDLPVFLDVSRVFPGGDLFDAQNNAGGVPLLAPITPNNPLLTAASALLFNKDSFTGKEVVKRTDTSAEAATKRAEWAWKQFAPAIAVGNYHFDRAMNVVANVTGEPVNLGFKSYTGVGNDGLPIQGKYAAMQTVGIKARPIDLETSAEINKSQREAMIRELDAEIRRTRRLANKGAITSDAEDQLIEQAREKRQRLKEGLTIDGEEK